MQQKLIKGLVMLASAGVLVVYQYFQQPNDKPASNRPSPAVATETTRNTAAASSSDYRTAIDKIRRAKNDPDAKFWTTVQGSIVKVLKDDTEGSAHQRFLVELSADTTLLVAHNIDLAQRVPVQTGQNVTISGEYVWNNRGGVLHWTHHDPKGRKGGWIELAGKRYE
ncbi:MAG: hypothetical protein RL122_1411 [Pseudomonadota bacterium]|jgi:hypothetical protein|uniref:DUF3465 domain-containing protein n=1 Tax=Thiothrix fructosivorans TaxID=111770 RepID=A0A8B0SHG0_9GAMM|nr:DUF3465 domain-containing protein [Thiothrix fructosivorans]MBO0611911.1 DUF3465 domain-containing protein [Thiothrix fructosivorans]QTX10444.1 DUF3465 domain-containing protein [Thiothrix fructosivorans]